MFKAFNQKLLKPEQGFTLVEVLVGILLVTIFTLVAMQAVVIATVFKARAKQFAQATTWIQEDLDNVKNQAAQVPYTSTTLTTAALPSQNTIVINSATGLRVGDALTVGTDATNNIIQGISGTIITLSTTLNTNQQINSTVIARCNANSTTEGFAAYLNNNLPALTVNNPNTGTPNILGKPYTLTRTLKVKDALPHDVLEVSYSVAPQDAHTTLTNTALLTSDTLNVVSASGFKIGDKLTVGSDINNTIEAISGNTITLINQLGSEQLSGAVVDASIATANTEVIPDAAFQCQ